MNVLIGLLLLVLGIGVLAYVSYRFFIEPAKDERRQVEHDLAVYDEVERSHMPHEIATGVLVASEEYFRTKHPVPLGAQVDQVYATADGILVPVDTKRRYRREVYAYDQIEVSVQACVLRTSRPSTLLKYQVADYGYVRVVSEGRAPAYLRVKLLSDTELVKLYDRYWEICEGDEQPDAAANSRICNKCAYLAKCPNPVMA